MDLQLSQGQKHQGLIHSESLKSTLNQSKDIKATTTTGTHSHILWNTNIWPSQQKAALVSQQITSHVCVNRYPRSLISNVIQGLGGDCWLCNGSKITCFIWSTIPTWCLLPLAGGYSNGEMQEDEKFLVSSCMGGLIIFVKSLRRSLLTLTLTQHLQMSFI